MDDCLKCRALELRIQDALDILENRDRYAPTAARNHASAVLRKMTLEEYIDWCKGEKDEDSSTD